jgi:hypothetical protein
MGGGGFHGGGFHGGRGGFGRGAAFATGLALGGGLGYGYGYPGYAYNDYDDGYGGGYVVSSGDDSSCAQRYRSYDPSSGTYLGYDGQRHSCQ